MGRVERLALTAVVIGVVSVVAILAVLRIVTGVDLAAAVERVDPVLIGVALLLHGVFWFLWGVRVWVMSRDLGVDMGLKRSLLVVISSLFAASITPSYAGGEPVRFLLIAERGDGGRAGAIVFTERFLDTVFFAGVAVVSIFFLFSYLDYPILRWAFLGAGVLLVAALAVFLVSLRSVEMLERILKAVLMPLALVRRGLAERLELRVERGVEEFHRALLRMVRENPRTLVVAAALTVGLWTAELLIPYVLFQGLGAEKIGVFEAVAGNAMLTVLLMVPATPGGSGLAEVGAVAIYSIFDDSAAVALFPLPWRLVTYYANLAAGLLVSAYLLKDLDLVRQKIEELG